MKRRFHDKEVSPQRGAPYGMMRELLVSPLGLPCNPPPWGVLTALDLGSRKILWQVPLGTTEELNPLGLARHIGTPTFGGPLATASGLVFIGAALDDYLRAFDAKTGAELWTGRLPSAGISTPTSYLWQGPPICRDRRRRPWRSRRPGRRHAGRVHPAAPRRVRPVALAALARPARRPIQAACWDGWNRDARAGGAVAAAAQATSVAGLSSRGEPRRRLAMAEEGVPADKEPPFKDGEP